MLCTALLEKNFLENRHLVAESLQNLRELTDNNEDIIHNAKKMAEGMVNLQLQKLSCYIMEDTNEAYELYQEYLQDMIRSGTEEKKAYRKM